MPEEGMPGEGRVTVKAVRRDLPCPKCGCGKLSRLNYLRGTNTDRGEPYDTEQFFRSCDVCEYGAYLPVNEIERVE